MGRSILSWLPGGIRLADRLKKVFAGAAVASAGLASVTTANAQVSQVEQAQLVPEVSIVNRSQKLGKLLLKLPMRGIDFQRGHSSHSSHSSHASHASHASGSTGRVAAPPASPKPTPTPVSTSQPFTAAAVSRPPFLGTID